LNEVKQYPCEWCFEEDYAVLCETCNKNLCAICNHSLHHKGMSELHVTRVDNTQIMKSSHSTLRTTNNGPWLDIEVK
jgi:hypothetical protein